MMVNYISRSVPSQAGLNAHHVDPLHDGETSMFAAGEQLTDAVADAVSTLTWGD
jgi:hypothetical protein